jgi:hypothetical protein
VLHPSRGRHGCTQSCWQASSGVSVVDRCADAR